MYHCRSNCRQTAYRLLRARRVLSLFKDVPLQKKKILWYSVVITTGSTTGNYHRTCPAVFWDVPQDSTTRSLPQEYHRSVPQKYHRAIPHTSCGTYHRKYHRKLPQVCGVLGHTTGQYHTLVTTWIPQVSTTGIPQVSTTGLPQELPQDYHKLIPQEYHTALPQEYHTLPPEYHTAIYQVMDTIIELPCTVPRIATCSLVN